MPGRGGRFFEFTEDRSGVGRRRCHRSCGGQEKQTDENQKNLIHGCLMRKNGRTPLSLPVFQKLMIKK
jgi:hypothetical protein